ncbi:uncharacterized protein [Clytia hemisphaerica]
MWDPLEEDAKKYGMKTMVNGKWVKLKYNSHGQLQADDGGFEAAAVGFIHVIPCKDLDQERKDLLQQEEHEKLLKIKQLVYTHRDPALDIDVHKKPDFNRNTASSKANDAHSSTKQIERAHAQATATQNARQNAEQETLRKQKEKEELAKRDEKLIRKFYEDVERQLPPHHFKVYDSYLRKHGLKLKDTLWDLFGRDQDLLKITEIAFNFVRLEKVRELCVDTENQRLKTGDWSGHPIAKLREDVREWIQNHGLLNLPEQQQVTGANIQSNDNKTVSKIDKMLKGNTNTKKSLEENNTSKLPKANSIPRPKAARGTKGDRKKGLLGKIKNRFHKGSKDTAKLITHNEKQQSGEDFDLDTYLKDFKNDSDKDGSSKDSSSSSSSTSTNGSNNGNIRQQSRRKHPLSEKERMTYAKILLQNMRDEAKNDTEVLFSGQGKDKETIETYKNFVNGNRLSYGKAPDDVPDVRVRRTKMEGSYPNWTVENENRLPKLLRYTWKGKLKKLRNYIDDPNNKFDVNYEDRRGRTALHMASSWGCIRTLKLLLKVPGIKLDTRDEHGKTPLFKAVEIGSLDCVKALVGAGANARIWSRDSRDPLTYLLEFHGDERFEIFKFLWDYTLRTGDKVEAGKLTLLHKAVLNNKDIVNLKCVNHMLLNEVDMSARDGDGRTAAHMCSLLERDDLLQLLIAHEVNPYNYDMKAKSPMDYAKPGSKIDYLFKEYLKLGPSEIEDALELRDGESKENKKKAELFRRRYFGFVPQ